MPENPQKKKGAKPPIPKELEGKLPSEAESAASSALEPNDLEKEILSEAKPPPSEPGLTREAREAIDRYLVSKIKWVAGIFGVANVLFVLASALYVFFMVPQDVVRLAQTSIDKEIGAQLNEMRGAYSTVMVQSGEAKSELARARAVIGETQRVAGESKAQADDTIKRMEVLSKQVDDLNKLIKDTKDTEIVKAIDRAKEFGQYKDAAAIASELTRLGPMESELKKLRGRLSAGTINVEGKVQNQIGRELNVKMEVINESAYYRVKYQIAPTKTPVVMLSPWEGATGAVVYLVESNTEGFAVRCVHPSKKGLEHIRVEYFIIEHE